MNNISTYNTNDLFELGQPGSLIACVGQNGGSYDFNTYCLGYFTAANVLIEAAGKDRQNIDLLVYPITYNYRHGIELGLKFLAEQLPGISGTTPPNMSPTHKLVDVWGIVKPLLLQQQDDFDPDGTLIPHIEKILLDIIKLDSSAQVFRFPTDRGGSPFLQNETHINLSVLSDTLEPVKEIFNDWFNICGELLELKAIEQNENDMV